MAVSGDPPSRARAPYSQAGTLRMPVAARQHRGYGTACAPRDRRIGAPRARHRRRRYVRGCRGTDRRFRRVRLSMPRWHRKRQSTATPTIVESAKGRHRAARRDRRRWIGTVAEPLVDAVVDDGRNDAPKPRQRLQPSDHPQRRSRCRRRRSRRRTARIRTRRLSGHGRPGLDGVEHVHGHDGSDPESGALGDVGSMGEGRGRCCGQRLVSSHVVATTTSPVGGGPDMARPRQDHQRRARRRHRGSAGLAAG